MSWWEYVQRVTGGESGNLIAKTIGGKVAASTVNSWRDGAAPKPETVLAFADAYDRPQREALLAAFLPADKTLTGYTDQEFLAELERRLKR